MDQIEILKPPKNPAKITDSRYKTYVAEFGASSWELDAVEPRQLAALVQNAVTAVRDEKLWAQAVAAEDAMRAELSGFVTDWKSRQNGGKSS